MNAWGMRTSRDSEDHRNFVVSELERGFLRQGWGYRPEQDLRLVAKLKRESGREALSEHQKKTAKHSRLLGNEHDGNDTILDGDLILVPNVPEDSLFTLCRVTGPYNYEMHNFGDDDLPAPDLGHMRLVINLTPGGVSFAHPLVDSKLRRSFKTISRLWNITDHISNLEEIILAFASGQTLRDSSVDHAKRIHRSVRPIVDDAITSLAQALKGSLSRTLQGAEWETVIQSALVPLLRDITVHHTGGAGELGADLEIHIPNPFNLLRPWLIAVQIKDYVGEIAEGTADQLEQAIISRREDIGEVGLPGGLIAVILASTDAQPSSELSKRMATLSEHYGVQVSCIHGLALMKVLARGFVALD